MVIFLDTYAIIEIDTKNPSYGKYALNSISAMTTMFNLIEVYFVYLKKFGEREADDIYSVLKDMVVPVSESVVKEAMKFKLAHQKKRFGIADCVGYITALKQNAKFITGDYAFKYLENVEFIK